MRRFRSIASLAALLWCALAPIVSHAMQPTPQGVVVGADEIPWPKLTRGGAAITSVQWGFDGTLSAEEHCPVWFTVEGGDDGVQGQVLLEYVQDASQSVRVITPVSVAPGARALVESVACMPSRVGRVVVTLRDQDQSKAVELSLGGTWPVPATAINRPLILTLGLDEAATMLSGNFAGLTQAQPFPASVASAQQSALAGFPVASQSLLRAAVVVGSPALLPTAWIAYEGVDMVVAHEDAIVALPPPTRRALMTWVHAGGRLVLVLASAGQRWQEMLPEALPRDVVSVSDVRAWALDDALRAQVKTLPILDPTQETRESTELLARATADPWPNVQARAMRVTTTGKAMGWSVRWTCDTPGDTDPHGLIAEGPAGFGHLTLLGILPSRIGETLRAARAKALWHHALVGLVPSKRFDTNSRSGWWWSSSGVDQASVNAISSLLDGVIRIKPVGIGVFFVLALGSAVMAFVVGPLGRVYLRKRGMLRRSWLLALACIGVAGVASLLVPMLTRSGERSVGVVEVQDQIADRRGAIVLQSSTRLVSIFADSPMNNAFAGEGEAVLGGWWRGVSPTMSHQLRGSIDAPVVLPITPAVGASPRSAVPAPVRIPQWNYRAMLGQRPTTDVPSDLRVVVRRSPPRMEDGSQTWTLQLRGVEPGRLARVMVRHRGQMRTTSTIQERVTPDAEGVVRVELGAELSLNVSGNDKASEQRLSVPIFDSGESSIHLLPMTRERSEMLRAWSEVGVLVVLELLEEVQDADGEIVVRRTFHRVAVPGMTDEPGREGATP